MSDEKFCEVNPATGLCKNCGRIHWNGRKCIGKFKEPTLDEIRGLGVKPLDFDF